MIDTNGIVVFGTRILDEDVFEVSGGTRVGARSLLGGRCWRGRLASHMAVVSVGLKPRPPSQ